MILFLDFIIKMKSVQSNNFEKPKNVMKARYLELNSSVTMTAMGQKRTSVSGRYLEENLATDTGFMLFKFRLLRKFQCNPT